MARRRRSHPISVSRLLTPLAVASDALTEVRVTDHAVLRWLERVHGIDVEFFREQLRQVAGPAAAIGASRLTKDGFDYILENARCQHWICPFPAAGRDANAPARSMPGPPGRLPLRSD